MPHETPVEKHPLDYDSLEIGSVVTSDRIELAVGLFFNEQNSQEKVAEMNFAILQLKKNIERKLRDRDLIPYVKRKGNELHILTEEDTVSVMRQDAKARAKRMRKMLRIGNNLDTEKLSKNDQDALKTQMLCYSQQLTVQKNIRRSLRQPPPKPSLGNE